jgi:hypothetical protein
VNYLLNSGTDLGQIPIHNSETSKTARNGERLSGEQGHLQRVRLHAGSPGYPTTGQPMQTCPAARQTRSQRCIFLWALAPIFLITGCHAMDNTPATSQIKPPALTKEVPLRFARHNFGVHCFNVTGCTVLYNDRYQRDDAPDKMSPPPPSNPDYAQKWMEGELDIRNFPPPAQVRWKSLDGVAHEAKVDIGAIFKDELIWHNVPKTDMRPFFSGPVAGDPDISLEVNDRTINVYIGMFIPTLTEQIPGNKYSYARRERFLAWSHTY